MSFHSCCQYTVLYYQWIRWRKSIVYGLLYICPSKIYLKNIIILYIWIELSKNSVITIFIQKNLNYTWTLHSAQGAYIEWGYWFIAHSQILKHQRRFWSCLVSATCITHYNNDTLKLLRTFFVEIIIKI